MAQLTPMMQKYVETKEQYKDCILFYRLGDFYEMFFEDAILASKELEITLTGKDCGQPERAPMCGIPYHAVDGYLTKLVNKGYKVAICEQVEDPKLAKGLVKREVIRIVTPGTNLNTLTLDETKNNYLMGIIWSDNLCGISTVDITTGDYYVTEVDNTRKLLDEIYKFHPSEIICNSTLEISGLDLEELKQRFQISFTILEDWYYDTEQCVSSLLKHFKIQSLDSLGLMDMTMGVNASGAVLMYLYQTQKNSLDQLTHITPYTTNKYMMIDSFSRRNLELTETMREKQKRGSLLWVLDRTKTAMGARMLRTYVEQPLIETDKINQRLDAIEELNQNMITREELREYLSSIYDLERLMGKISYRSANPRDLVAFSSSLAMLPSIRYLVLSFQKKAFESISANMDPLEDLAQLISSAIEEEAPISTKDGGIIKSGFSEEIDTLRKAKTDGKQWLAQLEAREKEETGIKNLKIKYNRVFGYYLEVTNSYKEQVPNHWVRKQTLSNAERYTTTELKDLEDKILNAEERLFRLEYEAFAQVREQIASCVSRIQKTAKAIAELDCLASLAYVAERNSFTRPEIAKDGVIDIKGGRHPVVEKMIPNDMFVANDTYLNNKESRVSIITGPNMAGKSTYMRQTALIVLMAQIGSFVPAQKAHIGVCDRIFTRVGASDDLASGQSTFMVEMTEVANILRNATKNSLLILDEIGRGTSTFDGLGIAWAVIEHISNAKLLGARTLFATHYHELTELEGKIEGVKNYCIAVKEQGDDIVFLRKIVRGGADKSYGVQVAKLAGVPESVLKRAHEIIDELSDKDITDKVKNMKVKSGHVNSDENSMEFDQISLFSAITYDPVIEKLKQTDVTHLTPIEAMNMLYELSMDAKKRE